MSACVIIAMLFLTIDKWHILLKHLGLESWAIRNFKGMEAMSGPFMHYYLPFGIEVFLFSLILYLPMVYNTIAATCTLFISLLQVCLLIDNMAFLSSLALHIIEFGWHFILSTVWSFRVKVERLTFWFSKKTLKLSIWS